ncbi:type I methionyl aminopeptidase [Paratractidigestivibacter sp.]|uniref:type I methionyl aminopeptidase n=1 Tax=Paratractidigestivibacter sp. TaxID=2847316 RepID=UPI002AC953F1|nr:type I methionyl aminopeptidase [Paratractidigestivibacter sp.]
MIKLKSPQQIEQMRAAGALSKAALRLAGSMVSAGMSTYDIDQAVESFIRSHDGTPTFKGYGGFPGSICVSVNDQVVHGIPSPSTVLKDGDIVSIDTGATYNGWVGDNAWTFFVGEPDEATLALCEVTRDCLKAGIEQAVVGNRLGDIGAAIQTLAEDNGFGVVRDYVGHGVGRKMHEDPEVRNYGKKGRGVKLQAGMVIAIEPMITMGTYECRTLGNGWTVVTADGLPAAHYENTVAITPDGPLVLTADDSGPWCDL